MKRYVLAGPFHVTDCTAVVGTFVAGVAQPVTTVGFVESLSRKVAEATSGSVTLVGGAVIVHEASFLDGHPKFPPSESRQSGKGDLSGAEMIDVILARMTATFLLEAHVAGDPEDTPGAMKDAMRVLSGRIALHRFAGGAMRPAPRHRELPLVNGMMDEAEAIVALRLYPKGFLLRDRRDLLAPQEGEDALDVVLRHKVLRPPSNDKEVWRKAEPGATAPISVGYRAIETPKARRTHRPAPDAPLHVYAESVCSLGEWVHLNRILRAREDPLAGLVWKPYVHDPSGLLYASATGPV